MFPKVLNKGLAFIKLFIAHIALFYDALTANDPRKFPAKTSSQNASC